MILSATVERHRRQLLQIVGTLLAMTGFGAGEPVERLYAPLYRAVLRLLRPAESAVRRLIVIAARGLVSPPQPARAGGRKAVAAPPAAHRGIRPAQFRLFDPRLRPASAFRFERGRKPARLARRPLPRVHVIDVFDPRVPHLRRAAKAALAVRQQPPVAKDTIDARRLCRRLAAIRFALEDLPRHAQRYARWLARPIQERRPQQQSALRVGRPPGSRRTPVHAVDEILVECDRLARQSHEPDTS